MSAPTLGELRRITEAVDQIVGREVTGVNLRSDCLQMRLRLDDGRTLLVSALLEASGPRLDVDIVGPAPQPESHGQLEVGLSSVG